MGLSWEEAEVTALDRHGWRRSVCGPVCPREWAMNQGQGRGQGTHCQRLLNAQCQTSNEVHESRPENVLGGLVA